MIDMSQFYTTADHFSIIPAVMLALFACAILLFDFLIFPDPRQRKYLLIFVVLGELFTGFSLYRQHAYLAASSPPELSGFGGTVTVVGAPSYASGAHMWKGTAEILKSSPTETVVSARKTIGSHAGRC